MERTELNVLGEVLGYGALGLVGVMVTYIIIMLIRTTNFRGIDYLKEIKEWVLACLLIIVALLILLVIMMIIGFVIYGAVGAINYVQTHI